MTCQRCGRGEATVHVTDILQNVRRERHLCDGCAADAHLFGPLPHDASGGGDLADPLGAPATDAQGLPIPPELSLQALVQLIFGPTSLEGAGGSRSADPSRLVCPQCGLEYAEFRKTGRLGCPADYDAFAEALLSLLERVHRSAPGAGHAGKTPKRGRHLADLARLRAELSAAVGTEEYETAARLRDAIRRKESDR